MAEFTVEEEKAIEKLQVRMQHTLPNEFYADRVFLYKFLKARNFDIKQAESMITKYLEFRKASQLDTIIRDYKPREVLDKYVTQTLIGFSKDGCPVRYVTMGNMDGRGIFQSGNSYNVLKHVIVQLEIDKEVQKRQSKKLGKLVCHSIFIYNFENFSLDQATHTSSIKNFMKGVSVFQDNYPEMLKRLYIINAQLYFTWAFALVKTILSPAVLEKIRVFGRSGWQEELLKEIDADSLPAFLGGKKTDPDGNPLCLTFVNHGGTVPKSYYVEKNINKTSMQPGMMYIRIDRQSKRTVDIHVDNFSSIINWEFELVNFDIKFGLYKENESSENPEELIPLHNCETELEPVCGMFRCKDAGKHIIVFDNSYSWFYPKEIYYRTWITDSKDAKEYLVLKDL